MSALYCYRSLSSVFVLSALSLSLSLFVLMFPFPSVSAEAVQCSCVNGNCDLGNRVSISAQNSFSLYSTTCPVGKHPVWTELQIKDVNQGNANASTFNMRLYDYYNNSYGMGMAYANPVSCVNITSQFVVNTIRTSVLLTCALTSGRCELTYRYTTRCEFDDCSLCTTYKHTPNLNKFAWCPAQSPSEITFCSYSANNTHTNSCADPITDCSLAPPYYPVDSSSTGSGRPPSNNGGGSSSSASGGSSSSSLSAGQYQSTACSPADCCCFVNPSFSNADTVTGSLNGQCGSLNGSTIGMSYKFRESNVYTATYVTDANRDIVFNFTVLATSSILAVNSITPFCSTTLNKANGAQVLAPSNMLFLLTLLITLFIVKIQQ